MEVPVGPVPTALGMWTNSMDLQHGYHIDFPRLVKAHGGIFKLRIPSGMQIAGGQPLGAMGNSSYTVVLADPELLTQVYERSDDFQKRLFKHSKARKMFKVDGLFTSDDDEPVHDAAARVLLPAFSYMGMKEHYRTIVECTNLLEERFADSAASGAPLDLLPMLKRYTIEVIGRVVFGTELGALVPDAELPEFVQKLEDVQQPIAALDQYQFKATKLTVAAVSGVIARVKRAQRGMLDYLGTFWDEKLAETAADEAAGRPAKNDMATRMITHPDPKSGEYLARQNCIAQCLTFLTAGHDSTSTAITMLLYNVAQRPDVEEQLLAEVLAVIGDGPIEMEALAKMRYLQQVVKENLRLFPPAPMIIKTSPPDREVTLGPYTLPPGTDLLISMFGLHHNPAVYDRPERFDPDRWSEENAERISPYAWLPFSYGKRGCIGMQLSMLEQQVALAMLIRRFHIRLHLSTDVHVRSALFMEAKGIKLTLMPRVLAVPPSLAMHRPKPAVEEPSLYLGAQLAGKRIVVLYGSNMGSCEGFAEKLATQDVKMGIDVERAPLDALARGDVQLPVKGEGAVVIFSSTYNGKPPENAVLFDEWLSGTGIQAMEGVPFAIFGSGNKQWRATYMAFPRKVHAALLAAGGTPLTELCEADMDGGEVEHTFLLWNRARKVALFEQFGVAVPPALQLEPFAEVVPYKVMLSMDISAHELLQDPAAVPALIADAGQRAQKLMLMQTKGSFLAKPVCNRELIGVDGRSTRHLEFDLPEGMTYHAGDHLGVMPFNPPAVVFAYLDIVGVKHDALVTLEHAEETAAVPLGKPIGAAAVLGRFFELQQPASRAQLHTLSKVAADPAEAARLRELADTHSATAYHEYIAAPRRTLLEVLQDSAFSSVHVGFGLMLAMLPPLRPRYYSISSSPLAHPSTASITVSVVEGPSPTGREHEGVASTCLRRLPATAASEVAPPLDAESTWLQWQTRIGVQVLIKDTGSMFRLPRDPSIPVILVGPGTGVAPMRGFIQERRAQGAAETVLFFGCRDEADFLYREELETAQARGELRLFTAYSRLPGTPRTYVQHRIEQEAEMVRALADKGACVYVCGDASRMAPDVKATFARVVEGLPGAAGALTSSDRYFEDVWASQSISLG